MKNRIDNRDFTDEWKFQSSRSQGPGGQHANKVNTKVTLLFSVPNSKHLTQSEKELIIHRLAKRIDGQGILSISSQNSRSQLANKKLCIKKFYDLLTGATHIPKKRKKTKVSSIQKEKRRKAKKRRSAVKEMREKVRL